jgi:hypothetical protein
MRTGESNESEGDRSSIAMAVEIDDWKNPEARAAREQAAAPYAEVGRKAALAHFNCLQAGEPLLGTAYNPHNPERDILAEYTAVEFVPVIDRCLEQGILDATDAARRLRYATHGRCSWKGNWSPLAVRLSSSSTNGGFILFWEATRRYGVPATISLAFSNLPCERYTVVLYRRYVDRFFGETCFSGTASIDVVTVTRDPEPSIDASTTEAGATPYSATTVPGSSHVEAPMRMVTGVNAHIRPLLSKNTSARGSDIDVYDLLDDDLGAGWRVRLRPHIHRSRRLLSKSDYPALNASDTRCLALVAHGRF